MGYFSQRKKRARENLFMLFSLVGLFFVYFILFFELGSADFLLKLRSFLFHIYLFNLLMLFYIGFHQKYIYLGICFALLTVGYTSLTAQARLFFNYQKDSSQELQVTYKKGKNAQIYVRQNSLEEPMNKGQIFLSPNLHSPFLTINQSGEEYTLISVDFSKVSEQEKHIALKNLETYVLMQNNTVIIYGDFGMPAWSKTFQQFLTKTDLSVKNKIIFSDGRKKFSFWNIPSINLISFKNIGLNSIQVQPKNITFNLNL